VSSTRFPFVILRNLQ